MRIKHARRNSEIRAKTIRLISETEGQPLTTTSLAEALQKAQETGVDLVQVSPDTDETPVCRLLDYNKFLYRQAKQQRKQKATQKGGELKGIRLGFATATHDLEVKGRKAREFLAQGHRVKVMLIFRGREITHFDLGAEKIQSFLNLLQDIGEPESGIQKQGKTISILLKPRQSAAPQSSPASKHEAEDAQRHQKAGQTDRAPQAAD